MRKILHSLGVVALALLPAVTLAAVANQAPATVEIKAAAAKKGPVTFPHKKHADTIACDTCHHTDKGLTASATTEVKPCSTCHLKPTEANVPSMAEMSMAKNPFHKVCIDCHKKEAKGPTKCDDCHAKKS